MSALIRFARWQIGSRLLPGDVIHPWVNGAKYIVRTGETGLTGNIYAGLHEFSDMGFVLHVLREADLFVDVGANVGAYTILACSSIGARGISFEPVPSTYERLINNIRLNNIENRVSCFNLALGDRIGKVAFSSDKGPMNHVLAENERTAKELVVNVSTLDEVLKEDVPFLMKIDVEGYETLMLRGATHTLVNERLCAIIMELNGSGERYGYNEEDILNQMETFGFRAYRYDPFKRSLTKIEGKNLLGGNTLFIRNEKYILDRIKNAPNVNVQGISF